MGAMVLVWGAVIAIAVWALARATRSEQVVGAPVESARALLDRRFAAGEIDAAEYAVRRRALEAPRSTDLMPS
jgi:uncharacterized membrane protein